MACLRRAPENTWWQRWHLQRQWLSGAPPGSICQCIYQPKVGTPPKWNTLKWASDLSLKLYFWFMLADGLTVILVLQRFLILSLRSNLSISVCFLSYVLFDHAIFIHVLTASKITTVISLFNIKFTVAYIKTVDQCIGIRKLVALGQRHTVRSP